MPRFSDEQFKLGHYPASDPLPKQHQLNKSPERELRALKTVV